jgi:hypothetical protein
MPPEDRFLVLREMQSAPPPLRARRPLRPTYEDGRRWPAPPAPPKTVWRLSISYWRIAPADAPQPEVQAGPRGRLPTGADARALRERLESPMTAPKPQKALDIGLFEVRPPEAPHILMPDE